MKKLLNLLLLVALVIGFVSCEPVENTDSKYESKLVGKWNATSIKGTLSQGSLVLQEEVITLPAEGKCESVVFDFKKDGTFDEIVVEADGDRDVEKGKYSVTDGKLILSYLDVSEEPVQLDIVDISNKNLILKASGSSAGGISATFELHFEKL
jgi:hypothetical protein